MKSFFLGLGSNIGNREENLSRAIGLLSAKCKIVKKSSIHETKPWGIIDQPDFLNMCIEIETDLDPQELMKFILETEEKLGRKRTVKNGPRTIDIDILLYGNKIISEENLTIPHPGMHERKFVLEPLCEIASDEVHPLQNMQMSELLTKL